MKRVFGLLCGLSLAFAAGGDVASAQSPARSSTVRIAAASDLRFALDEILSAFRASHSTTVIEATYGSSGNFFAQIRESAPFDVFLSADADYAQKLADAGLGEPPFRYATGRIALVVPGDSTIDPSKLKAVFEDASIKRISIANPAHAPYGRAAVAALRTWGLYDAVSPRLVLGDSVSQAAQFVDTGSADVGIVALSLARAPGSKLKFAEIPAGVHPPIEQAGLILKRTTQRAAAAEFVRILRGDEGRKILERYGFSLPPR